MRSFIVVVDVVEVEREIGLFLQVYVERDEARLRVWTMLANGLLGLDINDSTDLRYPSGSRTLFGVSPRIRMAVESTVSRKLLMVSGI